MQEVFKADTIGELNFAIESFIDNHEVYEYGDVTIIIELVTLPDSYYWKATLTPKDTASALKDALVEEHGYVGVFWVEEDILHRVSELHEEGEIPSDTLDERQMRDIKYNLSSNHDAEMGLSWETIDCAIRDVFDEEMLGDEEEDDNGLEYLRHIEKQYTPDEQ